jgi:hypothetical protein
MADSLVHTLSTLFAVLPLNHLLRANMLDNNNYCYEPCLRDKIDTRTRTDMRIVYKYYSVMGFYNELYFSLVISKLHLKFCGLMRETFRKVWDR